MDRRQFLAALAASAVVRPAPPAVAAPAAAPAAAAFPGMWQDLARTIPVTAVGQSVAVWDGAGLCCGESVSAVQPDPRLRPTAGLDDKGRVFIGFEGGQWMAREEARTLDGRSYRYVGRRSVPRQFEVRPETQTACGSFMDSDQTKEGKTINRKRAK